MGMFRWCPSCNQARLMVVPSCPKCGYRDNTIDCSCGEQRNPLCPHCDQPTPGGHTCEVCVADAVGWRDAKQQMAVLEHPAGRVLHDLAGDIPDGSVGRCEHCGGRTYTLEGVPWCPRAFCWTADGPQT